MQRLAVLAIALLALPLAPGVGAAHSLAGAMAEPGWVIFDYVGGSTPAWVYVNGTLSGPGVHTIDLHNTQGGGSTARALWTGRHLEVTAGEVSAAPVGLGLDLRLAADFPERWTGRLALWSASARDDWSWAIRMPHDGYVSLVAQSTDVVFMLGEGPDEGSHAHASAFLATAAVSDATYHLDVQERFVGVVGAAGPQEWRDTIAVTHPTGERVVCPCDVPDFRNWEAGRYRLDWDGLGLGNQRILAAGIDTDLLLPLN